MVESWQRRTMRDILRVLFTRWLPGLLILVLVVAGVWIATGYLPKVYETHVTILSPIGTGDRNLSGNISSDSIWELMLKTQHEILTGDTVLRRTLARVSNDKLTRLTSQEGDLLFDALRPEGKPESRAQADRIDKAAGSVSPQALNSFRKQVRMEVPGGQTTGKSQVFTIHVQASSADMAAAPRGIRDAATLARRRAEILTEEFIYNYHEQVIKFLADRMLAAKNGLDDIEMRYEAARKAYAEHLDGQGSAAATLVSLMAGPSAEIGPQRVQTATQERMSLASVERAGLEALAKDIDRTIAQVRADPGAAQIPVPERIRKDNPSITEWTQQLAQKTSVKIHMAQIYRADYPPLGRLQDEIRELQAQLLGALESGKAAIVTEIRRLDAEAAAGAAATRGGSTSQPDGDRGVPKDLGTVLSRTQKLNSERASLEQEWTKQLAEYNQARIAYHTSLAFPKLSRVESTVATPDEPIEPIRWLNVLIGAVVGLLLSLSYVFIADFYDHSVRSTDDVERYLGVPVLASVGRVGRHAVHPQN